MALRACNNPQITGPVLSREITKLVISHAEAEVGRLLQKRKADAVGELISFARDDGGIGEVGGGGQASGSVATGAPPLRFRRSPKPKRRKRSRRGRPRSCASAGGPGTPPTTRPPGVSGPAPRCAAATSAAPASGARPRGGQRRQGGRPARSDSLGRRCALPRGTPREVERAVEQARRRAPLWRRGAGVCAEVGAALFL